MWNLGTARRFSAVIGLGVELLGGKVFRWRRNLTPKGTARGLGLVLAGLAAGASQQAAGAPINYTQTFQATAVTNPAAAGFGVGDQYTISVRVEDTAPDLNGAPLNGQYAIVEWTFNDDIVFTSPDFLSGPFVEVFNLTTSDRFSFSAFLQTADGGESLDFANFLAQSSDTNTFIDDSLPAALAPLGTWDLGFTSEIQFTRPGVGGTSIQGVAVIPEPTTALLVAMGLLGFRAVRGQRCEKD